MSGDERAEGRLVKLRERHLATVVITDTATNGYVVFDAVQLVLVK